MNDALPDTRLSLILKLPKPDQQHAWHEFVELYDPFLYRFMRRRGLDDSAARDVVQRVMISVLKSIENWKPIDGGPKFRSWLFTIARNHLINERKRQSNQVAIESIAEFQLDKASSSSDPQADLTESDYRKEAILFAASRVRHQFDAKTWQAFWETAVEGKNCKEVAGQLGVDIASVYAARSRALRKIREQIQLMLECNDEL